MGELRLGVLKLPRWKCHKIVEADKIKSITYDREGLRWHLEGGTVVAISPQIISRGEPKTGDYYVVYEDGYISWSPKKAFEEGYTRMEETVDG
jgi:hypothetical protein